MCRIHFLRGWGIACFCEVHVRPYCKFLDFLNLRLYFWMFLVMIARSSVYVVVVHVVCETRFEYPGAPRTCWCQNAKHIKGFPLKLQDWFLCVKALGSPGWWQSQFNVPYSTYILNLRREEVSWINS